MTTSEQERERDGEETGRAAVWKLFLPEVCVHILQMPA
jgi:hypothetical protein